MVICIGEFKWLIYICNAFILMQFKHGKQKETLKPERNRESTAINHKRHSWIVIEPWTCSVAHATMKINGVMK
jgi:hypothetical protein